jgi:hypothetical protein
MKHALYRPIGGGGGGGGGFIAPPTAVLQRPHERLQLVRTFFLWHLPFLTLRAHLFFFTYLPTVESAHVLGAEGGRLLAAAIMAGEHSLMSPGQVPPLEIRQIVSKLSVLRQSAPVCVRTLPSLRVQPHWP